MGTPSLTDITGMIHGIAASSKIGTCLLATSLMYFISKRLGLENWEALPDWADAVALILLCYSAASVLWEAVPRIWNTVRSAIKSYSQRKWASRLDRYEKFVLLCLAERPAENAIIDQIDPESFNTTSLVIHSAAESLVRKGLARSTYLRYGLSLRLTESGTERVKPIQRSFLNGKPELWDD